MNPLDATVIRLGIYIGQLETQVQELHKQLLEKNKEAGELAADVDRLTEKGWERVAKAQELAAGEAPE